MFSNEVDVLYLVVRISAISSIIATLEWIYLYRLFKDDGLYSWKITKVLLQKKNTILFKVLNSLLKYPNVLILLFIQLVSSFMLLIPNQIHHFIGLECFLIAFCNFLISYRGVSGFNGADSTSKIVFTAAFVCFISNSIFVIKVGLAFMALQLIIAYTTPGWLRLFNKKWHNGYYLKRILRLQTFSRPYIWSLVQRNNPLLIFLSWQLILFESSFVFAIFLPISFVYIYLLFGLLFHVVNAFVMGLNTFVWSFLGIYPAFIWTSIQVHSYLFVN